MKEEKKRFKSSEKNFSGIKKRQFDSGDKLIGSASTRVWHIFMCIYKTVRKKEEEEIFSCPLSSVLNR